MGDELTPAEPTEPDLASLWLLPDRQLHLLLGEDLLGVEYRLGGRRVENAIRVGSEWFATNLVSLRRELCESRPVELLLKKPSLDPLIEAAAVFNALMAMGHLPAPAVLAVLVTRVGVRHLCGEEEHSRG